MKRYEIAFVVEQALGHITHGKNLQANIGLDPQISPQWAMIDFDVTGIARQLPLYNSNWTVRAGMRASRQLAAIARRTPLDAILFHTQVPAILAQTWVRRVPSIVSLDATPLQYDQLGASYQHERGAAWVERLKWRLNRDCYRAARHLVTWSTWTKAGLVADYDVPDSKITVIPPGVNTNIWLRQEPRLPKTGHIQILFVGGDLERKGGRLLIDAFRSLRPLGIDLHLVTNAKLQPEPGLFVYNDLKANSPQLIALYHRADIFALPTLGDCLPMVLSEAGAAGLAVVSTNVAAIPEIVRHNETGLLVEPGDGVGLCSALRELITNPMLRLQLGTRATQHVVRNYDAATNARRLFDLLKLEADRAGSAS